MQLDCTFWCFGGWASCRCAWVQVSSVDIQPQQVCEGWATFKDPTCMWYSGWHQTGIHPQLQTVPSVLRTFCFFIWDFNKKQAHNLRGGPPCCHVTALRRSSQLQQFHHVVCLLVFNSASYSLRVELLHLSGCEGELMLWPLPPVVCPVESDRSL